MAKIVLGIGTSHSPLLTLPSEDWVHRARSDLQNEQLNLSDGRLVSYDLLLEERGPQYELESSEANLKQQAATCEEALDRLADELEAAAPDVVIIVGDDQEELFGSVNQPAFAVYYGDTLVMNDKYGQDHNPDWIKRMSRGYMMDDTHSHPCDSTLALEIIEGLIARDVDVSTSSRVDDPKQFGFGHAFGFVIERLFKGRPYPVVPLLLNTYFPPNVVRSSRAFDIGQHLKAVLDSSPRDLRIAIIASGGLSHFVTDATLDRGVMDAMSAGDHEHLRRVPPEALQSGSSEILNWILTAGAITDLSHAWSVYEPVYRTPAGSGIGLGFAAWKKE